MQAAARDGHMKFNSLLITGTDTGVGKTTVSCGIAAALSRRGYHVGVFKPAETGCLPAADGALQPADAVRLQWFSACQLALSAICPYAYREPLAPSVAAQRDGTSIDVERLVRCYGAVVSQHDVTLIEGAGGLLVPLTPTLTFADLAVRLRVPVLLVVGSRLGAINHSLLTMRYARFVGLHVLGYVINCLSAAPDLATETNIGVLAEWLGPPLGVVPYMGQVKETAAERERFAELFSARLQIEQLLVPC
jgi:dethiobiotin synthetase